MKKEREAEVVLVGDELLAGERRDAHLFYFGALLKNVGIKLAGCYVVGDDLEEISVLLRDRIAVTSLIIVCGGLGPTADDVTREAVAKAVGAPLVLDGGAAADIEAFFESKGREASRSDLEQAHIPKGAELIPNSVGTAPGFYLEKSGCLIFVLPGPPRELKPMVEEVVLPVLEEAFPRRKLFTRIFRTTGIGESALAKLISPLLEDFSIFRFSSLPHLGGVDIVLAGRGGGESTLEGQCQAFERELKKILGYRFYGKEEETLEGVVGGLLSKKKLTLAIAESLSGGNLGKRITDVPGSSCYFLVDVVAYSNRSKTSLLGVREETLRRYGAVSQPVCEEMARGVRERAGSDIGLSTTGIAGPAGGSREKPVGLCFWGVSWKDRMVTREKVFSGSRGDVREQVTQASLLLLYELLEADPDPGPGSKQEASS